MTLDFFSKVRVFARSWNILKNWYLYPLVYFKLTKKDHVIFETKSGELIHVVLNNPTNYTSKLELEKDKSGNILIPFSAVIAVGDFLVVAEEDII